MNRPTNRANASFALAVCALSALASHARAGLHDGIVALYKGEGNSVDSVASHHGTLLNGATFDVGRFGQGFRFDGIDDYMTVAGGVVPQSGPFTVALFVDTGWNDLREYLSQGSTSQTGGPSFYIGTHGGYYRSGDSWLATGVPWAGPGWHHIAVTSDGTNARFFVDGVESAALGAALPNPPGAEFRLGRQFDFYGEHFDGRLDEVIVYNRALSALEIDQLRQVEIVPGAALGFCFGDGSGAVCPCGNAGAAGSGCANSMNPAGALLVPSGSASIAADTFVLHGSGMPNSSALYFQGTARQGAGVGVLFGDGLRCAGGAVIRFGTTTNAAGSSQYPSAGDPPISVRGANVAGTTRTYQVWYRNAAAFCTPSTFNLSNGLEVSWVP